MKIRHEVGWNEWLDDMALDKLDFSMRKTFPSWTCKSAVFSGAFHATCRHVVPIFSSPRPLA